MLRHGWRTAAIVPELEQETRVVSTDRYALKLTWLQALTGLMERLQVRPGGSRPVFGSHRSSTDAGLCPADASRRRVQTGSSRVAEGATRAQVTSAAGSV